STQSTGPSISFTGLAELFREIRRGSTPPPPATNAVAQLAGAIQQADPALLDSEPMDLESFCTKYKLSDMIQVKLSSIDVDGPYLLRLIGDKELRAEGDLTLGELAKVRYAEQRWIAQGGT
ncbi:hypothetical protein DFP72DRAFT_816308, partial [Ephemerocybe angulata]